MVSISFWSDGPIKLAQCCGKKKLNLRDTLSNE
jgi:hypothetical protein